MDTSSQHDQVDKIFAQFSKKDSPGCAVAVIRDGNIVHSRGYGMADLDRGIEITPTTVFFAASLAKQFTAMSIMLLVKSGLLSLDDPVNKYISVPIAARPRRAHAMIGELLRHISGIRDQWALLMLKGQRLYYDRITQRGVLDLVSRMKTVDFEPGEHIIYSNTGYTLAAEIIEKITSKSLSEFARENIFIPLKMNDTRIILKHDEMPRDSAKGYTEKPFQMWMPDLDVTGPTNLITTVEDLARWDRNFSDETVGGGAVLAAMQTPAKLSDGSLALYGIDNYNNKVYYGLGVMITEYAGLNVVEHDGRDAGYRSHLIRFPDQRFAVACLCNVALEHPNSLPRDLVRQVAEIYLADKFKKTVSTRHHADIDPPPVEPDPLRKFIGRYRNDEIDSIFEVALERSGLVIKRPHYNDTHLEPASIDAGLFAIKKFGEAVPRGGHPLTSGTLLFLDDDEKIVGFSLDGDRENLPHIRDFRFKKLA